MLSFFDHYDFASSYRNNLFQRSGPSALYFASRSAQSRHAIHFKQTMALTTTEMVISGPQALKRGRPRKTNCSQVSSIDLAPSTLPHQSMAPDFYKFLTALSKIGEKLNLDPKPDRVRCETRVWYTGPTLTFLPCLSAQDVGSQLIALGICSVSLVATFL